MLGLAIRKIFIFVVAIIGWMVVTKVWDWPIPDDMTLEEEFKAVPKRLKAQPWKAVLILVLSIAMTIIVPADIFF